MRVHINRPSSTRFIAQTKGKGMRKWKESPHERVLLNDAIRDMARMFSKRGHYRGRVIMIADYYDPVVVVTMQRV